MEYINPVYTQFGTINCVVNHPKYGWIRFTADPNDPEQHGVDLYNQIVADGNIAEHVAPVIPPEVLEAQRIAAIKSKAQEIINAKYPEWKQRNMLAEASYLDRNDPTNPRVAELEAVWAWVQLVRSTSDAAEVNGTALEDIVWPS